MDNNEIILWAVGEWMYLYDNTHYAEWHTSIA